MCKYERIRSPPTHTLNLVLHKVTCSNERQENAILTERRKTSLPLKSTFTRSILKAINHKNILPKVMVPLSSSKYSFTYTYILVSLSLFKTLYIVIFSIFILSTDLSFSFNGDLKFVKNQGSHNQIWTVVVAVMFG